MTTAGAGKQLAPGMPPLRGSRLRSWFLPGAAEQLDPGRERYRRAGLAAVAGGISRLILIAVSFVSVPLLLGAVGVERYGLWAAVGSVTGMLVFADFGLGNGLVTAIAAARAKGDDATVRTYVSSGFFMLAGLAAVLGVVFAVVYFVVPWAGLFNVSGALAVSEAGPTMAVFFGCFLASLPLGVASRVQLGFQESYLTAIWTAAGSLLSLVALIVLIAAHASLPLLVLALSGAPVVALVANSVVEFRLSRPSTAPAPGAVERTAASRLLRLGFLYFVLQAAVAVAYQSDVIVAARVVGPEGAADYSIVYRLFMVIPALLNLVLAPLWPAYTDAIGRGDIAWVRRTLRRSTLLATAISTLAVVAVLIGARGLLDVWVGRSIQPPDALLYGMAAWAVLTATFTALAMLFNGAAVMRFQLVVATVMSIVSVAASILLATRFGVAGVVWGTVIAYVVFSAVPQLLYLPRLLASLANRTPEGSAS
jgi:O-antigen/teichoic acid export membrane protein